MFNRKCPEIPTLTAVQQSTKNAAEMPIKYKAKSSALFYIYIARAGPCFNCFKELTHEHLIKAYPFQPLPLRQICHLG